MLEYIKAWLELKVDRRAVTALEYGLIAAMIAVAVATILGTIGGNLNTAFTKVNTALTK